MSAIYYLFPVLIVAGMAFYYLNIYRKGKAAGGGFMAGVMANHEEKWKEFLDPGEHLRHWGTGVLWRPWWQYWLARQFPFLKLVWPMKVYQMIVTDRERLLMANYTALGLFADKKSFPKGSVQVTDVIEEEPGLAMKLNPLVPKDYKTYQATLVFAEGPLKLYGIPGNFMEGLKS